MDKLEITEQMLLYLSSHNNKLILGSRFSSSQKQNG
jgi:hypothetical protein